MNNGKEVILMVYGDEGVGEAAKTFLEEKRYEAVIMKDGRKALDYLKGNPFDIDLVVLQADIQGFDGMELLKSLKLSQHMREVPVVIVMDRNQTEQLEKTAMDNGAEDIITLPCDGRIMANRLHNILVSKGRPMCTNILENILERELDKHRETLGVCRCRQCRKDVLTLALNRLKPKYVSTEKGRLISAVDQMSYEYMPELLLAITASAETVKTNPRHGSDA